MSATTHRAPGQLAPAGDSGVVARAAADIEGLAVRTPLQANDRLSELVGARVLLKREDLQPVRSYKIRGAVNLIRGLSEQERQQGVVCASAGNHAQGVALACAELGVRSRIYLPRNTPRQKRDRVSQLGGEHVRLILHGDTYDDAAKAAVLDASRTGATLAPAFDDPRVIAGQGTVTREILEELGRAPDILLVPVGGGGLLAGALLALAEAPTGFAADRCRVIAVEPVGAASLQAALAADRPVDIGQIDTFADGTAVRKVGEHTFGVIRRAGVDVATVETGAICQEMLRLYQVDGIIAEPSGAMPMADLDRRGVPAGAPAFAILSGGNNDVSRYAEVIERALVHEGRKHYFLVDFPQEPGALRRFLQDILGPDDDITFFEYVKRNNREFGPALVGVELGDPSTFDALLARAEASPLVVDPLPPDSPMLRYLI